MSVMKLNFPPLRAVSARFRPRSSRSYGGFARRVQKLYIQYTFAVLAILAGAVLPAAAADRPVKLVAFGDSLTAGYGLPAGQAFPVKLEQALKAKGLAVEIANAGVSGDTATDGLSRIDWSVPDGVDGVILELGANDALRGLDPKITRDALDKLLARFKARGIPVLLTGMRAPPNMGADYVARFDAIFPDLAKAHDVPLYPFFLDGVAALRDLNQRDGIHPTAAGVDLIVARIAPMVEDFVAGIRARRPG